MLLINRTDHVDLTMFFFLDSSNFVRGIFFSCQDQVCADIHLTFFTTRAVSMDKFNSKTTENKTLRRSITL